MTTPQPHSPATANTSQVGLVSVFASTFFQLSGIFMMSPMLLLMLKKADISTTVAGLFAATTWLGIFIITPFASALTQWLGRRPAMWLASGAPVLSGLGFWYSDALWFWFALQLLAGVAGGLRWVLAEAFIAEFAPPQKIGRAIGLYATMVGLTFIIGPALLAWVGTDSDWGLWLAIGLMTLGLVWTAFIPHLAQDHDHHSARVGLHGLWQAIRAQPVIMLAGFTGGFFELGLASILPLYGLAVGLSAGTAAVLVSVSGLGGTLVALPVGMLADRFASPQQGRRLLMTLCTALILASTLLTPWAAQSLNLLWAIVFVWGAAGAALYTLSMTDIGSREKGMSLVNSTAVLVLTYTLGGLCASSLCGALIDRSFQWGFPALLVGVATIALVCLQRTRKAPRTQ